MNFRYWSGYAVVNNRLSTLFRNKMFMLDEMFQRDIAQGIHQGKNKVLARNEIRKNQHGFLYSKSMAANFEALCWHISSSINLLFLKSISAISINANPYIVVNKSRFAEKKVFQFLFFSTRCRKLRVKSFVFSYICVKKLLSTLRV